MVTRYTRLLYKSIVITAFVLFGVFSSLIDTKAQNPLNPQFLNCWPDASNYEQCNTITIDSMIIQYMGCDVKIHYHRRLCFNGTESFYHIEMNRIVFEQTTPPCGLVGFVYNSSPAPLGSINEANFRQVVTEMYIQLSDSLIMNPWRIIPQEERPYTIMACDENGLNFRFLVQAFEGSCMAYCASQYVVFDQNNQPRTMWEYRWNKCANTCCQLKISYCWDNTRTPPEWRRVVKRETIGQTTLNNPCDLYSPMFSCQPIFGYVQLLKLFSGTCKETCGEYQRTDYIPENE